jgi:hypothetical protein
MTLKYIAIAAALAIAPAAFAQSAGQQEPQVKPTQAGPGAAGETSDRTPDKAAQTPQNQQDTAGDKTSDRSQDKNVKVEHQPGAAGTAGASSSQQIRQVRRVARSKVYQTLRVGMGVSRQPFFGTAAVLLGFSGRSRGARLFAVFARAGGCYRSPLQACAQGYRWRLSVPARL